MDRVFERAAQWGVETEHYDGLCRHERAAAKEALGRAMAWRDLPAVDFLSVTRFLADTPARLLMVSLEDVLGDVEQVNLPGTIDEHPNWPRRLSVPLEDLLKSSALPAVAQIMDRPGEQTSSALAIARPRRRTIIRRAWPPALVQWMPMRRTPPASD